MNYIIRNKISKKSWVYLAIILLLALCIIVHINIYREELNHEHWVKRKEQEFQAVIDLTYSVMKGEKNISKDSPLYLYDISDYVKNQDEWEASVEIKIIDIEELIADKKFKIKVVYTQILLDKNGETLMGSSEIDSDWTVEKGKDGMWEIVDIDELA